MVDTRNTPSDVQLGNMIDEARQVLDDLERGALVEVDDGAGRLRKFRTPDAYALLRLCSAAKRDGRRSNSRPGVGGQSTVLDDNGQPMPALSDPVGEAVVTDRPVTDPIIHPTEQILRLLAGAQANLRAARGNLITASQHAPAAPPEPGCKAHESIGIWVPVKRNSRCRWCYNFWLAEGQDPPVELLKARDEGKQITQDMVKAALAPKVKSKRSKKGKKRSRRRHAA